MKYALLALAPVFLLLVGCATSVNSVERAAPQASAQRVEDRRIITDSSLSRKLEIIEVNETFVSGDLLKIQATLANKTTRPRSFAYSFEWIGSDGMERRSAGGGWRVITLQGGERKAISAVANSPEAVDFRLKFQER